MSNSPGAPGLSAGLSSRPTPVADPPATAGGDPFPAVASAAVTAPDGTLLATVSRGVRPGGPGAPGPEVVVTVRGDVDLDTAPLVRATLIQALDGADRVCLDLGEVTFFGAAGVRVVVAARQHAASLGRELRLSGVHGLTERVLDITGLSPGA